MHLTYETSKIYISWYECTCKQAFETVLLLTTSKYLNMQPHHKAELLGYEKNKNWKHSG